MLVGIQLTLKEYSEVVLDVYSKNCEFCLVFISYVASIVFTLILLQNAENIATLWIRLAYLWGTFNLLIVPLFIYNSFILFNPRKLIDRFLKIYSINDEGTLKKLSRISSRSMQSQNVEVTAYILQKIDEYVRTDFSKKLETIGKMVTKRTETKTEQDLNEFKTILNFSEELAFWMRFITLHTIDQFNTSRISQNEAIWILDIIHPIFRTLFTDIMITLYPIYSSSDVKPEVKRDLERSLEQCLRELELIVERLQEAPPEIKREELRNFLDVLPYNFINSLTGYDYLVERAKRLQEILKDDKKNNNSL